MRWQRGTSRQDIEDRTQRMSGRGVPPEKFTLGSSARRVEWFSRGLESGRVAAWDAFGQ